MTMCLQSSKSYIRLILNGVEIEQVVIFKYLECVTPVESDTQVETERPPPTGQERPAQIGQEVPAQNGQQRHKHSMDNQDCNGWSTMQILIAVTSSFLTAVFTLIAKCLYDRCCKPEAEYTRCLIRDSQPPEVPMHGDFYLTEIEDIATKQHDDEIQRINRKISAFLYLLVAFMGLHFF
uniref:Uncharacterized protein n=1 Tax=Acrobeloides nanus TaxID=290746 RepID=A0A914DUE3_9BILA